MEHRVMPTSEQPLHKLAHAGQQLTSRQTSHYRLLSPNVVQLCTLLHHVNDSPEAQAAHAMYRTVVPRSARLAMLSERLATHAFPFPPYSCPPADDSFARLHVAVFGVFVWHAGMVSLLATPGDTSVRPPAFDNTTAARLAVLAPLWHQAAVLVHR